MRKLEDYQFKLARDMYNFNQGGGNGLMLMVETTMEMETSILEEKLELVISLLMINLLSILLKMIMGVMIEIMLDMIIMSIFLMIVMKMLPLLNIRLLVWVLECVLLPDKSIGKYIEQRDYVLPFLGVFMRNVNAFILSNQHEVFLSEQIAFFSSKHELSIVVTTFKTLFENTFSVKFYHLYFKEFLFTKDFENQIRAHFEMFKINLNELLKAKLRTGEWFPLDNHGKLL
ncbi:hypothetical protein M9H77_22393 [Catharanthus roseus]|uniref:Uncharacterized protein n=1 Tax=Catharanthus roseus TaxID=4058 RepID=A0ACC0AQD0_CATRO|nr:hypothetical protein M9H77_22393 [Catharanthus roseus]